MVWVRFLGCCVGLVACLVTVGCGGGSGTTAGPTTTRGDAVGAEATGGRSGGEGRAIHEPVQSRGIKGEDPTAEAATSLRISAGDCAALGRLAEKRLGTQLTPRADPSPPLSRCRLSGRGTQVNVFLDSGFAAHQRYANRIEETVQFNGQNPAGLPQPVPARRRKGRLQRRRQLDPGAALAARRPRQPLADRDALGPPAAPTGDLRDEAAILARAGFKLTAAG